MATSPDDASLLSSEELAKKLSISSRCILNWLYAGTIPAAVRVGKVIRFREEDVMAALAEATRKQATPATPSVDVVRLALWLVLPDVAEAPSWRLVRNATPEEKQEAARLAAIYWNRVHGVETTEWLEWLEGLEGLEGLERLKEPGALETTKDRRAFCQGVVDAAFINVQKR